ncbi:MAG: FkbM family methyltransferase [Ruminococcaceae bacterium]|nr:FkbM family methyltransferase [Oscillospiraceae bacterium]
MTEKITAVPLWDYLKAAGKPIVLYGMGNGADMIIEVLEGLGLDFSDVFASDGFVRGHFFHGKKVLTFSEVKEKYEDFIILMTFAVHDRKTLDAIKKMSKEYELYSPTVPIAGKGLFTLGYIKENEELFDRAYSLLYDERSKEDFVKVLNFKVSGDLSYLFSCEYEKKLLYEEILHLGKYETIVDLGAYDGDTIREFLSFTGGNYKRIIAFEPDGKNFRKLSAKTEGMENLELYNLSAWNKKETLFFSKKKGRNSHLSDEGIPVEADSVDNTVKGEVTFIKMDIEGAELKALEGAKNTVSTFRPKLYVCAYHRNEDFFTLPIKIKELCESYRIYFRHHPYIPAWESNFYAIAD